MKQPLSIISLAVAVIALAVGIFNYTQTPRLAYVDTAELLNNYEGMKVAREAYQKKTVQWKANVDTLMSEVQQAIKDYEKEASRMSSKEQDLSKQLIKTKQDQLRSYQQAIQQQSQQEDQQMTEAVLSTVNSLIKEYGESNSYKIIIGATNMGNVVYAKEGINITQDILEILNKEYSEGE